MLGWQWSHPATASPRPDADPQPDAYAEAEVSQMAHPEYLYYATMFLVALPAAVARGIVASIVFGAWAIGQSLWLLGLPEPQTQLVIYLAALMLGLRYCPHGVCTFAAVLFFPLALVSLSDWLGWMTPAEAWWSIYWIALTQAMSLPFTNAPQRALKRLWGRIKEGAGMGMLRVAVR